MWWLPVITDVAETVCFDSSTDLDADSHTDPVNRKCGRGFTLSRSALMLPLWIQGYDPCLGRVAISQLSIKGSLGTAEATMHCPQKRLETGTTVTSI